MSDLGKLEHVDLRGIWLGQFRLPGEWRRGTTSGRDGE